MRCTFCSASLYVEAGGTVNHLVYRPAVRPDEVEGHVGRWLFEAGLETRVVLGGTRLVYYPFWRVARGSRVDLVPAAASPVGPLDEIVSPAGELEPHDEGLEQGAAFVPSSTPAPAGEKVWLVHVPVYHAGFDLGGLRETVLVEATAGKVVAATSPPGTLGRTPGNVGWVLWGGATLLVLIGAAVPLGWAALAGWGVTIAGVFLLVGRRIGGRR